MTDPVKTARVLDYDHMLLGGNPYKTAFVYRAPVEAGDALVDVEVRLPGWLVNDLGEPAQVTVTIEPGDRLNEPSAQGVARG